MAPVKAVQHPESLCLPGWFMLCLGGDKGMAKHLYLHISLHCIFYLHWPEITHSKISGNLTANQNATMGYLSDPETPEHERKNVFGGKWI